jgi:hypothetical protein
MSIGVFAPYHPAVAGRMLAEILGAAPARTGIGLSRSWDRATN